VTDDEAFIRAIVDGRGDDTPRLVYADWLDDRADPRGAYLRAEAEWARPWRSGERPADNPELRELAKGLDPVWVARVGRPPVGVCRYDVTIVDGEGGDPVTDAEFHRVERRFDIALPADYRAFLLNWNGGRFVQPAGGITDPSPEHLFYPLDAAYEYPWQNLEHAIEYYRVWVKDICGQADDPIRRVLLSYIPFGVNADDTVLLGVRGTESGRVAEQSTCYHHAHERDIALLTEAVSFAEYMARPWPPARPLPPPVPDDGFRF
jgi:uncharacterized protein (TIGR02996 family)